MLSTRARTDEKQNAPLGSERLRPEMLVVPATIWCAVHGFLYAAESMTCILSAHDGAAIALAMSRHS